MKNIRKVLFVGQRVLTALASWSVAVRVSIANYEISCQRKLDAGVLFF